MSKYNEDFAETRINNNKMRQIFNSNPPEPNIVKSEDDDTIPERKTPDEIIYDTIDRANKLLDKLELEIESDATARLFEVASALINSITQASNSIIGSDQHNDDILIKQKTLELKERETAIKEAIGNQGKVTTNNNMIVTSREDIIKLLKK